MFFLPRKKVTVKQNQAYAKTKEIEECDRKRDDLFVFVRQTIDSGLYHPVSEKRAAAERLLFALKPYRMANQQPFAENTALVTNMTQDMLGKDYIDDVRLLDLEGPIKLLDEANNEFNTLYSQTCSTDTCTLKEGLKLYLTAAPTLSSNACIS